MASNENQGRDRDNQNPSSSSSSATLSVTEAHPKEEKPFADWQDDPEKVRAHAEFTADVSAARKKEASSEPVKLSGQNERNLAVIELAMDANGGEAWRRDVCRCDPDVGAAPCEYCAIHGALKLAKRLLSSQPNEEQGVPPVTQTPSMEGANKQ